MDMLTQNNLLLMNSNNGGNKNYLLSDNPIDEYGMTGTMESYKTNKNNSKGFHRTNPSQTTLLQHQNGFTSYFNEDVQQNNMKNMQFIKSSSSAYYPMIPIIGNFENDEYSDEEYYNDSVGNLGYTKCNTCYSYYNNMPSGGDSKTGGVVTSVPSSKSQAVGVSVSHGSIPTIQVNSQTIKSPEHSTTSPQYRPSTAYVKFDSGKKEKCNSQGFIANPMIINTVKGGGDKYSNFTMTGSLGNKTKDGTIIDTSLERNDNKVEDKFGLETGKAANNNKRKRKTQANSRVRVELTLIFVKVGQVDTVNERYQADIFLQSRWREPLLDRIFAPNPRAPLKDKSNMKKKPCIVKDSTLQKDSVSGSNQDRGYCPVKKNIAFTEGEQTGKTQPQQQLQLNEPGQEQSLSPSRSHPRNFRPFQVPLSEQNFWNPRLNIDNAQGEPKEVISHEVEYVQPNNEAYLVEKRRIKGVFHETLELKHFPFDCQDLSLVVTSERPIEEVELVSSPIEISYVDQRCTADSQEWNIFQHVEVEGIEIQTAYNIGPGNRCQPGLKFTSRAARRSGYFMINTVLISCVLCLLSFSAFSVKPNQSRMQLSLLLLLTTVTFKFAASQNLPKISYLTYLDKVVLINFFMLVTLTVWHSVVSSAGEKSLICKHEAYFMYGMMIMYAIGVVIFCLVVYLDAGSRKRLMRQKDLEFQRIKYQKDQQKSENLKNKTIYALQELLANSTCAINYGFGGSKKLVNHPFNNNLEQCNQMNTFCQMGGTLPTGSMLR